MPFPRNSGNTGPKAPAAPPKYTDKRRQDAPSYTAPSAAARSRIQARYPTAPQDSFPARAPPQSAALGSQNWRSVQSGRTSTVTARPQHRPEELTFYHFKLGAIINAQHFGPLLDYTIPEGDSRRFESAIGPGSAKNRYMVVIAKFPRHMLALPITSCSGRGISGLSDNLRKEYVGIKRAGDTEYISQSPHLPVELFEDNLGLQTKVESHIHLVGPIYVPYSQAGLRTAGNITGQSFERLSDLIGEQLTRAMSFATVDSNKPIIDADGFTQVSGSRRGRSSFIGSAVSGNSTTSRLKRLALSNNTLNSVPE